VLTFVGFPPTPCFTALLRRIADFLCEGVIRAAFAAGKHFGYFFLPALLRPHFSKPPPFLGLDISTQFSPNHFVKLTVYLFLDGQVCLLPLRRRFLPIGFFLRLSTSVLAPSFLVFSYKPCICIGRRINSKLSFSCCFYSCIKCFVCRNRLLFSCPSSSTNGHLSVRRK